MFMANPVTLKTAKRCEVLTEVNYEVYMSSGMSRCDLQETGTNSVVGTASSTSPVLKMKLLQLHPIHHTYYIPTVIFIRK